MKASIFVVLTALLGFKVFADEAVPFQIHGQGWTETGKIVHASDSVLSDGLGTVVNLNGATRQASGAQLTIDATLGANWNSSLGIGVRQVSNSLGTFNSSDEVSFYAISLYKSYVAQAWLRYFLGEEQSPWFSITAGSFAFNYNPDVKDLGLYLLRGSVYPGIVMSGFQEFDTDTTKSTQTGFRVQHSVGNFSHNLLLVNERVLPPTFDWSLAYVAKYRAFDALNIGVGVNFYRLIPNSAKLETPGRMKGSDTVNYEVSTTSDTLINDTLFYTHQGTKLMAMFSLDLKSLLGIESMGTNDFKLYGEAAILGVKNYGSIYNHISERIPVMVGFNVPTFGVMDLLSLEVEWYGTRHKNDIAALGNVYNRVADWTGYVGGGGTASPVPVPGVYSDSTRDNWKWAVLIQKTVAKHVQIMAQIANDHYRPTPSATGGFIWMYGGTAAVLTTPKDWYYTARLGFFF
jgi:hypothetical protein